jgi:hypothetical protein
MSALLGFLLPYRKFRPLKNLQQRIDFASNEDGCIVRPPMGR